MTILAARKEGNLKYKDTQLPEGVTKTHGFHIECYRRFIALSETKRKSFQNNPKDASSAPLTRSRIPTAIPTGSSGAFSKICIFCLKKVKKHKNSMQKLIAASTENFQENVKMYLNDQPMLLRIGNEDFVSKEIYYHGICRVSYQSRAEKTPFAIQEKKAHELDKPKPETSWHVSRELHCKAFGAICCLINENVLEEKEVVLLSDLNSQYKMLLAEIGGEDYEDVESNSTKLKKKLVQHYKKRIKIIKGKTRRGNLVFSSEISDEEAFRRENSMKTKIKAKIRDVAFELRQSIIDAEKLAIPDEVKLADIMRGEVEIPDILFDFFT